MTEEQLIQWLFDLAESDQAQVIADHVAQCDACTVLKTQIEQKFAQLDLLQGDAMVSEALVLKTQAYCEPAAVRRVKLWWISAAACVAFAGLIGMMTINQPHEAALQGPEIVQNKASDRPAPAPRMEITETLAMDMPAPTMAAQSNPDSEPDSDPGPDPFAKTPFAPASAIELVTLPRRENVQVTIYNEQDLTLVREQRKLTLKRGWNWLQFMWANTRIDPTSLDLLPKLNQDEVTIEQLVYPAGLKDIGRWLIRSEINGQVPFELTYFTSGLSWRSVYMGTLSQDETCMDLKSYVRVDNRSGEDFDRTQVRLVLGDVQVLESIAALAERRHAFGRPEQAVDNDRLSELVRSLQTLRSLEDSPALEDDAFGVQLGYGYNALSRKDVAKKTLSEYVLYTIEGTEDLNDQSGKRLISFEANDVPVESLYKYDEDRWGKQAIRFVSFANNTDHKLGNTPMPQGQIKLFGQAEPEGLTYVGASEFKYIPVNQEVTLDMGPARYVKIEPTLMSFKTTDHTFDPNGNLTGWSKSRQWEIEVTNTRSIPVKIEITRALELDAWTLDQHSDTMTYEKYNTREARFTMTLAPREQRHETYTVTTYHGTNQKPTTTNQSLN
ncbi:MAG: DUF4139 domain-containing protein [Phycisphaerae bacterium]|nr:DUF4139 domain-containing protein [Phycisphaerae bacterium]